MYLKHLLAWLPIVVIAFANAAIRQVVYARYFGELAAHQLATLTISILVAVYVWALSGLLKPQSPSQAIGVGACRFKAEPGEGGEWVTGACHDPTGNRAPRVLEEGGTVRITESEPSFERIPAVFGGVPRYELELGKERPFALTIETGASEFEMDLGGVPLRGLTVRQGAGRFEPDFSAPNPHPMDLLEVSSGAAGIELESLANANFSEMQLAGGAASYELDFRGRLSRDARVNIETGLSGVEISVPAATAARVVAETTLGSVDVGDGFTKREGAFLTEGALAESMPLLTVRAGVRLGSLTLRAI